MFVLLDKFFNYYSLFGQLILFSYECYKTCSSFKIFVTSQYNTSSWKFSLISLDVSNFAKASIPFCSNKSYVFNIFLFCPRLLGRYLLSLSIIQLIFFYFPSMSSLIYSFFFNPLVNPTSFFFQFFSIDIIRDKGRFFSLFNSFSVSSKVSQILTFLIDIIHTVTVFFKSVGTC